MDIKQNLNLFRELISCNSDVYTWIFNENERLSYSNCPQEALFHSVLSIFGCKDYMYEYGKTNSMPLMLSTALGLDWVAAFEREGDTVKNVYLIGPVFSTEISMHAMEKALNEFHQKNMKVEWKRELLAALEDIPTVTQLIFRQYALMLHYCVTGSKIKTSDVANQFDGNLFPGNREKIVKDRHKTWQAEQALLHMVREGDLNYKSAMDNAATVSPGVPVRSASPIRQAKVSTIVFISLCTRAAIEGGLSPEQAYALGDEYIQNVEDCKNLSEVAAYNSEMYKDFVHRVHKAHENSNMSKQIKACCDYIELHVEEKISIQDMAQKLGYTEYYLSRKFKLEMNSSINSYIKKVKIERAKLLLTTTDDSIQEIADRLDFCTRSYFGESFRKIVGCSPIEYRNMNKKI